MSLVAGFWAPRASGSVSEAPRRVPVVQTNLAPAERALLADPNYVTEDEADVIISERM